MTPSAGNVVAERFRLVRLLGQGGMGAVWSAHHLGLDMPCAIKFIHAEAARSSEIRARFELEARAAAQLRSPHVVQILDHGVWDGSPYIAMEYLEGEDLGQRLRARGAFPPHEVAVIMSQVARALAKAHAAGLVHRDLKPANIFLARDDDREIVKVLDFGVAKSNVPGLSDSNTKTGAMLGTPFYMSPEQAQGTRVIDHRADLWSLGVVTYQLLTASLPFKSEALGDLLMKIMMAPIPVPSEVASVPPGFDAWFARAVSRDPAGRFSSAKEFAETLADALGVPHGARSELGLASPSSPGHASNPGSQPASWPSAAQSPSWPNPAAPATAALSWPNPQSGAPSWPNASQLPAPDGPATVALQSGVNNFPQLSGAQTGSPLIATGAPLASSSAPINALNASSAGSKSRIGLFLALIVGGLLGGALIIFLVFGGRGGTSANAVASPSAPSAAPTAPTAPTAATSVAAPIVTQTPVVASASPIAPALKAPVPSAVASASTPTAPAPNTKSGSGRHQPPASPVTTPPPPPSPPPAAPPAAPHQPDFGI